MQSTKTHSRLRLVCIRHNGAMALMSWPLNKFAKLHSIFQKITPEGVQEHLSGVSKSAKTKRHYLTSFGRMICNASQYF